MPRIELGFAVTAGTALLLTALAFGAAWITYRFTVPPVSRRLRLLLVLMRGSALSLILLLLCEPVLRLVATTVEPPGVAVLIDNSRSMSIRDRSGDRGAVLTALVRDGALERLTGGAARFVATFGVTTSAFASSPPDSLPLTEEATDLAGALRTAGEERERHNLRAVVLLTDGAYTLGQNPLHEAERLGLPLFPVAIGDSTEQQDILITTVVSNDLVYADTEVPVDVTVKSSGYAGKRVDVVLQQEGRELARSMLTVEAGTHEYPVRLAYVPRGEGMQKFSVRVSALEGELTAANNRRAFFARVLRSRLRVLLLAGAPSPDLAILRQTLAEQQHLQVRSSTQRQNGGWYEGELRQSALDSADCLITIGFPTASTTDRTLEMVRTAITTGLRPLLYIDGTGVDEQRLRTLGATLPFTVAGLTRAEQLVFLVPSPAQQRHPLLAAGGARTAAWDRLPPVFRRQGTFRARPEAQTLATFSTQSIVTQEPLLVLRSVNRQKSLAVLAHGLWRWRLMAQGNSDTEGILAGFLSSAVRWLTTREDDRPVKTVTAREQYTRGEPVEFLGQVYDATAAPVDDAELTVTMQQQDKEYVARLRGIGNGRYEGRIDGLLPGDYTFRSVAMLGDQRLGEDRGKFSVGELDLEFVDTRMNAPLLRQLAYRTGGRFLTPAGTADLPAALSAVPSFTQRTVHTATALELWNWRVLLGILVVLLGLEWFLRKRRGML